MTKNLLFTFAFCLALGANAQTQLQNGTLSAWNGTSNPQYWATPYTDSAQLGNTQPNLIPLVTQDFTTSTNGSSSVKMVVARPSGTTVPSAGYISACMALNGEQSLANDYQVENTAPDSVAFDFKFLEADADEPYVYVGFVDNTGAAISGGGTNGYLIPFLEGVNGVWNHIVLPVTPVPNCAGIAISFFPTNPYTVANDGVMGTSLWIDNVSLIYTVGCPENVHVTSINPTCNGEQNGGGSLSWTNVPPANIAVYVTQYGNTNFIGPYTPTGNPYTVTGLGPAGNYVVQMQSTSGCTVYDTFQINDNPALVVSASSTPVSGGNNNGTANVNVSGGVPSYTYSWSNGQHSAGISGLATGTYTCTVTDAAGCAAQATAIVGYPGPTVTTNAASSIHLTNATLNATVNPNGTTDTISFDWGTGSGYGNNNPANPSPVNGLTAVNVSTSLFGLLANTTYYYRAVATTLGTPYYGQQLTFYTSATGIPQVSMEDATVYPNPAKHQFTVNTQSTESYQLFVYNMLGQKVVSQTISQPVTNIDVSMLSNGIYTVSLVKDEAVKSFRQVIINE